MDDASTEASMVGLLGRVTGTVGPGLVGEVIVRIRGGAEHFLAHPAVPKERIEIGTVVTVMEHLPPRTVYVTAVYDG
ncbi:hypothetical protein ACWDNT_17280 [Streptomyces sp. NPDC000963]|uniref:hypothetical protein n=1 Tax=unclassified Streptomyces TaxID=2593676 RepID=UPI0013958B3E|nr:hypothetical protein [Streptomyces sp. SID2131]